MDMFRTDPLPITHELLSLIAAIDEAKGAWRATASLAPDRLSALRRVATIESIGSSTRIEGSRLSDREVEALLGRIKVQRFAGRDEQEVAGYARVMETVFVHWRDIPVTENHIRQLHRDLLAFSDKDERHRGAYKTHPNAVVAKDAQGRQIGVVFEPASPFDTPARMAELVAWLKAEQERAVLHPLLLIGIFVVVFLEVHPFEDGNGRLSRILTTLLLLRAGYSYVPYASLESVIEADKEGYYLALRQTQGSIRTPRPRWRPWLLYFLRALRAQAKHLDAKLQREKVVLAALPELDMKIVEFVKGHGRVTLAQALKLTGANRNTLKLRFRTLTEKGYLKPQGRGRGAWYGLGG